MHKRAERRRPGGRLLRQVADDHKRGIDALRVAAARRVRHVMSFDIGPVPQMLDDPRTSSVAYQFLAGARAVAEGSFIRDLSCACCDTRWALNRPPIVLAIARLDHIQNPEIVLGICRACVEAAGSED